MYTRAYAEIKHELQSQASHRIPNTMETKTSGRSVASFLVGGWGLSVCDAFPSKLTGNEP